MNGVKRINIIVDKQKRFTQRAPTEFKCLLCFLKKLGFNEIKLGVEHESKKGSIFDQKSYQKWIENSDFKGINLIFDNKLNKNQIIKNNRRFSESAIEDLPQKRILGKNKKDILNKRLKNQEASTSKVEDTVVKSNKIALREALNSKFSKTRSSSVAKKKCNAIQKSNTTNLSLIRPASLSNNDFIVAKSPISLNLPTTTGLDSSLNFQANLFTQSSQSLFSNPIQLSQALNESYNPDNTFVSLRAISKVTFLDNLTKTRREIFSPWVKASSKALMTENGLIITGGSKFPYQAYLIDKQYNITKLVSMRQARFWHSMGFIDGHPAVFGGSKRDFPIPIFLDSVEVYKDYSWMKYPNTNVKRASCSASWYGKYTYIIGGLILDKNQKVFTGMIEKWDGSSWIILNIKLIQAVISPGCICVDDHSIFIFGGGKSGYVSSNKIFKIDLDHDTVYKYSKSLPKPATFTYGQLKYNGHEIIVCDINLDVTIFDPLIENNILSIIYIYPFYKLLKLKA